MKLFDVLFKREDKSEKMPTALSDKKEVAETVQQKPENKTDVMRTISNTVHKENNVTEYEYLEVCPEGIVPSKELAEKLPAPGKIQIASFSNASKLVGKRYSVGMNDYRKKQDFIQYKGKLLNNATYDEEEKNTRSLFVESFHPFIQIHTNNIAGCAENILSEFSFKPDLYEITADNLNVQLASGYYDVGYEETVDFIRYKESYQESTHDGGGSGSKRWCIYAAPTVVCKAKLSEEIAFQSYPELPGFVHLPHCRGHWEENGHVYLVDPWGLSGIFEYYCHAEECRDYASDNKVWEIGVPYAAKCCL